MVHTAYSANSCGGFGTGGEHAGGVYVYESGGGSGEGRGVVVHVLINRRLHKISIFTYTWHLKILIYDKTYYVNRERDTRR